MMTRGIGFSVRIVFVVCVGGVGFVNLNDERRIEIHITC